MLPLISAGLGAALSYWGEKNRQAEEKRAIEAQKEALKEAKYTFGEKANILDKVSDQYNTSSLNTMNASALGLSGVLNSDTLRGLTASKLLGERANRLSETELSILDANKKIDTQIAGLGTTSSVNVGNIIGGGLAGYQIGESVEKSGLTWDSLFGDDTNDIDNNGITTETNIEDPFTQNIKKKSLYDTSFDWRKWKPNDNSKIDLSYDFF